jgi:hypothetical protein
VFIAKFGGIEKQPIPVLLALGGIRAEEKQAKLGPHRTSSSISIRPGWYGTTISGRDASKYGNVEISRRRGAADSKRGVDCEGDAPEIRIS